jgi:hypothetical protein
MVEREGDFQIRELKENWEGQLRSSSVRDGDGSGNKVWSIVHAKPR